MKLFGSSNRNLDSRSSDRLDSSPEMRIRRRSCKVGKDERSTARGRFALILIWKVAGDNSTQRRLGFQTGTKALGSRRMWSLSVRCHVKASMSGKNLWISQPHEQEFPIGVLILQTVKEQCERVQHHHEGDYRFYHIVKALYMIRRLQPGNARAVFGTKANPCNA